MCWTRLVRPSENKAFKTVFACIGMLCYGLRSFNLSSFAKACKGALFGCVIESAAESNLDAELFNLARGEGSSLVGVVRYEAAIWRPAEHCFGCATWNVLQILGKRYAPRHGQLAQLIERKLLKCVIFSTQSPWKRIARLFLTNTSQRLSS